MADHNNQTGQDGSKGELVLKRAGKFILGKGFYIVLFLCIAAIGVSGYVILTAGNSEIDPNLPNIPDVGLSSTVPYSGIGLGTSEPDHEAGSQTLIPDSTTAPPETTAKPPQTTAAKVFYMRPVAGEVIRDYSESTPVYNPTMDDWRVHTGIDIAAESGEAVCAVAAGTVSAVYEDYFKGVVVEILHLDGRTSVYCGLAEEPEAVVGDSVTAGTIIGGVGETAIFESLDGAHLHFEMKQNGAYIDPNLYLPDAAN